MVIMSKATLKKIRRKIQNHIKHFERYQPHNLSDTEPAHAIVSRNDANERENVVLYDPIAVLNQLWEK